MAGRTFLLATALVLTAGCGRPQALAAESYRTAPVAAKPADESAGLKTAIFAGGCFWGVEGVFSHVKGVTSAVSGYHGGSARQAHYDLVSGGGTAHAEAVKVTYDPEIVRYDELLRIFFSVVADPTLVNRQGPDIGTHYRSALVPLSAEQRGVATAYLDQLGKSGLWKRPIATRVEAYRSFYAAETYHQDFMALNPDHAYILSWDRPKVAALKKLFPAKYSAKFRRG